MLTPAETASRIVADLSRRISLSHDDQSVALLIINEGIEADRQAIYSHFADTAPAIICAEKSGGDNPVEARDA